MAETQAPARPEPPELDRFHEIELAKAFEAILHLNGVRAQLFALFSTLNVAAVTLAFSTGRAGLLVFGGLVWLLGVASDQVQREIAVRFFYRAWTLQRRFAPQDEFTYLSLYFQDTIVPFLPPIDDEPSPEAKVRALRRLARRHSLVPGTIVVLAISLLEIALGLYLMWGQGWKAF